MHARLAAAQQQQQQAKQAQAQLQQQQQQQQAAVPQPPPQQQGNAFANMTPQQLMAYGFNPTQVEYMRSQQQAEASATAGLAAATGDVKPPGPQRANSISSLKPQTTEPSLEQMSEARSVVNQLRMAVEGARRQFFFLRLLRELYTNGVLLYSQSPTGGDPRRGQDSSRHYDTSTRAVSQEGHGDSSSLPRHDWSSRRRQEDYHLRQFGPSRLPRSVADSFG